MGLFFYTRGEGMNIRITPYSAKGAPALQAKPSGSPISHLRFKRGAQTNRLATISRDQNERGSGFAPAWLPSPLKLRRDKTPR